MCLFKIITNAIAPIPDIEKYDSYLFVAPHPDDIEIGCGGTVKKLTAMGKKVYFLIATDGRYGSDVIPPEELVKVRHNEVVEGAKVLGVKEENITFLSFFDGGGYDTHQMTLEICKVIMRLNPDVVLAPDFACPSEFHIDHTNVGKATCNAFVMSGVHYLAKEWGLNMVTPKAIALYYTHNPNRYVKMAKYNDLVFEAMCKHESQYPTTTEKGQNDRKSMKMYLKFRAFRFGIRRCSLGAEGFRVLGAIHVHCCPEANWM